jgi:hypothetical protein
MCAVMSAVELRRTCGECGKAFSVGSYMTTHRGVKQPVCGESKKAFDYGTRLRTHETTDIGAKVFIW